MDTGAYSSWSSSSYVSLMSLSRHKTTDQDQSTHRTACPFQACKRRQGDEAHEIGVGGNVRG